MALDPSIALSVKPVQIDDPLEQYGKVMTLKGLVNQQQMQANQLQDYQRNRDKQTKLSDLTSKYTRADENGIPTLDKKGYLSDLMTIDPETALDYGQKFQKQDAEAAKLKREAEDAQLEQAIKQIGIVGQLMNGVKDQASYDAAVAQGRALGLPGMDQVNPTYNPSEIERYRLQALTVAEQLAYLQKERDAEYRAMNDEKNRQSRERQAATLVGLTSGKSQLVNAGDGIYSFNPYTNQANPVIASNGNPLVPPSKPKAADPTANKINDANDVLTLLNDAEPLVKKATGSKVGSYVDSALGFVGKSTESGDAAAQLKALEGLLVSKMPKMSGPQSDKDVAMYKQMAGNIGNPETPESQKMAAIKTIRAINQRYANQGAPSTKPQQPAPAPKGKPAAGVKFLGFE